MNLIWDVSPKVNLRYRGHSVVRAHHFAEGEEGDKAASEDEGGEDPGDGVVVGDDCRHSVDDHGRAVLAGAVGQALCSARNQRHAHSCQAWKPHTLKP